MVKTYKKKRRKLLKFKVSRESFKDVTNFLTFDNPYTACRNTQLVLRQN